MSKVSSPLLGYNNNVRHHDRVFHIQTEDSGLKRPHVMTHLFMDGGRILKSVKTSYADRVEDERVVDYVRQLMKEQHKAMFVALRDGHFDALVDGALAGGSARPSSPEPPPVGGVALPPPPASRASLPPLESIAPPSQGGPATARDFSLEALAAMLPHPAVDLAALERASLEPSSGLDKMPSDLPPPPPNLLSERPPRHETGRYHAVTEMTPLAPAPAPAPAVARSAPPVPRPSQGASRPPPAPAVARPAAPVPPPVPRPSPGASRPPLTNEGARYSSARPAPAGPGRKVSIFGDDMISDQSLDDVILSYLGDDLDDADK